MSFHSVVIQKFLSANAHIGRRVTSHHFKIFSEGTRNSVSIIDSDKTLICLRNACNFIGHLARNNARFLFVNTNSLFDEIITQMTQTVGIKNDMTWRLGGFLTNSSSPRKFRGKNKKFNLSAIQAPDCIVIFDTERKSSVIHEASRLQIPVVGLVDSSMPWETYKKITYPVPANDSMEFVYLFCNLITKTILKEQKEAVADKDKKLITGENAEQDIQIDTTSTSKKFVFPYESLQDSSEDVVEIKQLFDKLVVLKINDSMGTKVGFNGPKCAMEISSGLTSVDFIINQIEALNTKYGCNIPLLLVNAVNAHEGVSKVLEKHPNKNIHSVTQSHLFSDGNSEPSSAKGRDKHDDMNSVNLAGVFLPLRNSGKLDVLLSQGKEYILMLSDDNLAHVVDPKILNHLIQNNIEFCLELMPKSSELDTSKLTPNQEDIPILTPKKNWKFIDTMWININSIESLAERRAAKGQLTISQLFDQYFALSVPKSRYVPVKATTDIFLLQSDLYTFKDGTLTWNADRENRADPSIELGPVFENVNEFRRRFKSIPSVVGLRNLKVTGDVWFGTGVTLKGKVTIHARPGMKIVIPDGTVLEDKIITSQADVGGVSL